MRSRRGTLLLLGLLCLVIACISLATGAYHIELSDVWAILTGSLLGESGDWTASDQLVLVAVRLPRILLVILVGASLAVSGAVLQAVFRNPLVSPYLLGISSGGSFGAALMMVFLASYRPGLIQLSAFLFGMLAVFLATSIARIYAPHSNTVLILAGVVVASLFSALVGILKYIVPPDTLRMIELWTMGSFAASSWQDVLQVLPIVVPGCALMVLLSWRINVLSLGEQQARTLGVDPRLLRWFLVAVTSLMTSVAVAVCGPIGWVGIIIPHSVRMMVGANNLFVILGCMGLGSAFLLLVDLIARTVVPGEIPISILTAIIGAGFFIVLVSRARKGLWSQ